MPNLLQIIKAPDKKLLKKAQKVYNFDQKLYDFAQNMLYTMINKDGCGLASIQVEDQMQFEYKEFDEYRAQPDIFIIMPNKDEIIFIVNAKILEVSQETSLMIEGCLSIPEIKRKTKVNRPEKIKVEFQDLSGNIITTEYDDMHARIFQHEYDHNQGIIFPSRLNKMQEILFWKNYLINN